MSDPVVAIVSAFFVIGIVVGIIAVVAASVLRADRRGDPGDPLDYERREPVEPPPSGYRWDGTPPAGYSHWPGDTDSNFSSR
jgi:hypothetical protein